MDEENEQTPKIEEFKGNKVLVLNPGSQWPFSIGVKKARMVVEHIDTIRKFAESNGTSID